MTDSRKSQISRHLERAERRVIDLRAVVDGIINGLEDKPPAGQWVELWRADPLHRVKSFRDVAPHVPETSRAPNELKSGFVHQSIVLRMFIRQQQTPPKNQVPFGKWLTIAPSFYCVYDTFPSVRVALLSEIWTLILDDQGNPVLGADRLPQKDVRWTIQNAMPYRERAGRLEYWELICERQAI